MFSRKKRELMKTPSISKKNRAGSPSPQPPAVSCASRGRGRRPGAPHLSAVPAGVLGAESLNPASGLGQGTWSAGERRSLGSQLHSPRRGRGCAWMGARAWLGVGGGFAGCLGLGVPVRKAQSIRGNWGGMGVSKRLGAHNGGRCFDGKVDTFSARPPPPGSGVSPTPRSARPAPGCGFSRAVVCESCEGRMLGNRWVGGCWALNLSPLTSGF